MLCKKSEKNLASIFHKTWKTSFWAHFGSLWPKNPKTRFYSKRQVASLLKLNETLTSSKKTKKFLQLVPNINSRQTDKQPNGQMDWGTSQDLHFEGLKRKIWSIVENIVVSIIYTWQNAIFNEIWRQTLQNKMFIGVLYNSCSEKSCKFYRKLPPMDIFFEQLRWKMSASQVFFMNFA